PRPPPRPRRSSRMDPRAPRRPAGRPARRSTTGGPGAGSCRRGDLRAEDVGARGLLAVDPGDALVQRHVADGALEGDLQVQPVARHDHARELRAVDLHQVEQLAIGIALHGQLGKQPARLRQRLEHQHPGHHRLAGEVPVEEVLVGGDVLVGQHAVVGLQLDHPVHQQERIAVRQQVLDRRYVDRQLEGGAHSLSFRVSIARSLRAISSRWRKRAALRRQLRLSIKPVPEEYSAGCRMEPLTRLMAVTTTRSQISRWPAMPTAPPIMQYRPMRVLPAMAVHPAMAVWSPIRTLWATWIRLSSRTSRPSSVSSIAPRSMQVFAPISQSSPTTTPPSCGTLIQCGSASPPRSSARPKPSAPSTAPGWIRTRRPSRTRVTRVTRATSSEPAPTTQSSPTTQPGPSTAPASTRLRAPMLVNAPML